MTRKSIGNTGNKLQKGFLNRAITLHRSGKTKAAIAQYRRYLKTDPYNSPVMHTLAGLLYEVGRIDEAIRHLERVVQLEPDNPGYANDLAGLYLYQKKYDKAEQIYRRLIVNTPDVTELHYNLGLTLYGRQLLADAIESFETALGLQPEYPDALYNLGVCYTELGHLQAAEQAFQRTIAVLPYLAQAHHRLGRVYQLLRRREKALDSFQQAHDLAPDNQKYLIDCAEAKHHIGQTPEGIAMLNAYLKVKPHSGHVLNQLGHLLHDHGDLEAAERAFRLAMKQDDTHAKAALALSLVRKFNSSDSELIRTIEDKVAHDPSEAQNYHFALAKIYDDLGEYDTAFNHYQRANEIQRKSVKYDRMQHEAFVTALIETFNHEFFNEHSGMGSAEALPLLIIGMPRSGTTLTEQILASHPSVAGAGELLYFSSLAGSIPGLIGSSNSYPQCMNEITYELAQEAVANYKNLLRRY